MKRTQNACRPCRQSKIKCSGDQPCSNCQRRLVRCLFEDENVKVMVSRRYLHDLQKQVRDLQQRVEAQNPPIDIALSLSKFQNDAATSRFSEGTTQTQTHITPGSILTSPFDVPSTIMRKEGCDRVDWAWLAPPSIFSFYDRVGLLITEKLHLELPKSREELIYPLQWDVTPPDLPLLLGGLPSIDHALFLFSSVKFNFCHVYRLFEEDSFIAHVKEFYYGDGLQKVSKDHLWFVQFLLILAFGKAFSEPAGALGTVPGSDYFCNAMALMPDLESMWQNGVAAIEVLTLAALFMYCIDHRVSAHIYLGQAIRIAMIGGLHTRLPEEQLGHNTVAQCRKLWWTLYILDRRFSSSLGIPVIVQDHDIATLIITPDMATQEDATLCLQVKLWQLMSHILSTIYRTTKIHLGDFLEMTKSILKSLADYAQEMEKTIELKFHTSVGTLSKGTRLVTLTYHQCVIFATRPLFLSILKELLEERDSSDEGWQNFLALTANLISTGIKSASSMLRILSSEGDLLETFFLNDLEFVYGASLFLTMATALFPKQSEGRWYRSEAHAILDKMISKGNRVAEARKKELLYLEHLFDEFTQRSAAIPMLFESGNAASIFMRDDLDKQTNDVNAAGPRLQSTPTSTEMQQQPLAGESSPPIGLDLQGFMGISSYEFYSIIEDITPFNSYDLVP